jgi:2'-5' RNA ligase
MARLFIGLPVNQEAAALLKTPYERLGMYGSMLKLVKPVNYHITIKFIGECDSGIADAIERDFGGIPLKLQGINYVIRGLGAFPETKRASVIWCGLRTDSAAIKHIHSAINDFIGRFGIKSPAEEFVPHLTIARVRKGRTITRDIVKFIEDNGSALYGESYFGKVILYSSRLTPDGPVYTELKAIEFE